MAVRLPDPDTHRREFASLPFSERRAIARAVNRGQPVEQRKHAAHAVLIARRQQRTWRWMWVLGALIGLVQLRHGWAEVIVGSVFGAGTLALVGWWFTIRARRAEEANLALLERGGKRKKGGGKSASADRGDKSASADRGDKSASARGGDKSARADGGGGQTGGAARGHIPRSNWREKDERG